MTLKIKIWGALGSYPLIIDNQSNYSNHTACISLTTPYSTIIFDAGSGLHLLQHEKEPLKKDIYIFLSHFHIDHISALHLFTPLFSNYYSIKLIHPNPKCARKQFFSFFDNSLSPLKKNSIKATLSFIKPPKTIDKNYNIDFIKTAHSDISYAYKIEKNNKTIIYATDNELTTTNRSQFINFFKNTSILIHDAHHIKKTPPQQKWGHSYYQDVIDVAEKALVEKLILFHHNPHYSQTILDKKTAEINTLLCTKKYPKTCIFARDKMTIIA